MHWKERSDIFKLWKLKNTRFLVITIYTCILLCPNPWNVELKKQKKNYCYMFFFRVYIPFETKRFDQLTAVLTVFRTYCVCTSYASKKLLFFKYTSPSSLSISLSLSLSLSLWRSVFGTQRFELRATTCSSF